MYLSIRLATLLAVAATIAQPQLAPAAGGGQLVLSIVDRDSGQPVACRVHLVNEAGKPRKAYGMPFFHDHFVCPGEVTLKLPKGGYRFTIDAGPEYPIRTGHFTIEDFADDRKTVDMHRACDMAAEGWWAGDLDVRRDPKDLGLVMAAEGLRFAQVIDWDNRPRDKAPAPPPALAAGRAVSLRGGCDRSGGGPLLLLRGEPLELPAAGAEVPTSLAVIEQFRAASSAAWIDAAAPAAWDLPLWLAHGAVDSIELAWPQLGRDKTGPDPVGCRPRDARRFPGKLGAGMFAQEVYFHALNCGFRLPPTAGSGSGEATNPVGYNRVYVYLGPEFSEAAWWDALRQGRAVVTNGPLLRPLVSGQRPGHVFRAPGGEEVALETSLNLSTRDTIDYLEIIKNGQVERAVRLDEFAKTGELPALVFDQSGWFAIRAVSNVEDTYRFALTAPYYVEIGGEPAATHRASAEFFLDWAEARLARLAQARPAVSAEVLALHENCVAFWKERLESATAP